MTCPIIWEVYVVDCQGSLCLVWLEGETVILISAYNEPK